MPSIHLVELLSCEVHQRITQQLDLNAVGVLQVHRLLDAAIGPGVLDPSSVEPFTQLFPSVAGCRDRDVLDTPDRIDARLEPEPGEVAKAPPCQVAEVEEEVRQALVVTVLDKLDQRKPKQALIKLDRLLDIRADERRVVNSSTRRGVLLGPRPQVLLPQFFSTSLELLQLG